MGSYKDLVVWNLAREVVKLAYEVSSTLPEAERFGLVSQMRRAAVSIPCNIAEGAGRKTDGSFGHFLRIAGGSVNELETLLVLCEDLGYLTEDETAGINKKLRSLGIKIHNLAASIKSHEVYETAAVYGMETDDLETTGRLPDDN
jgi:four helix bundle protein